MSIVGFNTERSRATTSVKGGIERLFFFRNVTGLDVPRILRLAPFGAMGTPVELLNTFGGRDGFEKAVDELQAALVGPRLDAVTLPIYSYGKVQQ